MIECDHSVLKEIVTKRNYDNSYRIKIFTADNHIQLQDIVNDFIQNLTDEFYIEGMSDKSICICYRSSLEG